MYRQRRSSSAGSLFFFIIVGLAGGIGYFLYDNGSLPTFGAVPTPTVAAVAARPPITPTITPMGTIAPTPTVDPYRPAPGTTIFIPAAGISSNVITTIIRGSTWDVTHLGTNVGHLQGTSWLGQRGNVVLSGHVEMSSGEQGVFAALTDVGVGDEILLTQRDTDYTYRVDTTFYVDPDDLSVVRQTAENTLTLITCSDYNFFRNSYDRRFVVVARQVG
jgi:LPXTG-site transpeptidase (sortase) family protein